MTLETRFLSRHARAALPACLFLATCLAALPADAKDPQGVLYGKITTRSGSTYEGRLRWGKEEAFWGDHFNSAKENRPYVDKAPRRERQREPIKIFGITIGLSWDEVHDGRTLVARFGDIHKIRVRGDDEAVLVMKNGTEIEVDGGSNDLGGKVRVWDREIGEIDVRWDRIDEIELLPTPSDVTLAEHRLFGTVKSKAGEFRGFIQWDQDECLSSDKLDGDSRDGEMSIEMGTIRAIERYGYNRSKVVLASGREVVLEDSNDVDSDNRGIFVDDDRYGRVLVEWDAFERLDLSDPETNGPAYGDFLPAKVLSGKVTGEDGQTYEGTIVYDLDESETWEILEGDHHDVRYHIPFGKIASIAPASHDSSRVVLINGEELELEDSADVGEAHDGVLILGAREGEPVYLAWNKVRRIDFDR